MRQAKRSIVLEENKTVVEILECFEETEILSEKEHLIFFKMKHRVFGIIFATAENISHMPIILVRDEDNYDFPHIMYKIYEDDEHTYRQLCLFESGSLVNVLLSFQEKVELVINQLITLLELHPLEIEKEFQKEFLFYWEKQTKNDIPIRLYIKSDFCFQKLNVYSDTNKNVRIVSDDIRLNDKNKRINNKNKWNHLFNIKAYYIPITDKRRVIPPVKGNAWTSSEIIRIIQGMDFSRISHDTYEKLKEENVKADHVYIIFEMEVEGNFINFCCLIKFKDAQLDSMLNKLKTSIKSVEPLDSKRCDYYTLNRQIGNDNSVIDKSVAIIGAGSLGSYIATELVKSGIRKLTLIDGDNFEESNVMRHTIDFEYSNIPKVNALKYELEKIHPEIEIQCENRFINAKEVKEIMNNFDMIIFTVGSSDTQFLCNRVFKKDVYGNPIVYAWLEAGGTYSHVLKVDYQSRGCFECLFTSPNGELLNNKANKLPDNLAEQSTIRNGCGGTRVAYGTEVLLRTTNAVLNIIKKTFSGELTGSHLIDIDPISTVNMGQDFAEGKCKCCSDKD